MGTFGFLDSRSAFPRRGNEPHRSRRCRYACRHRHCGALVAMVQPDFKKLVAYYFGQPPRIRDARYLCGHLAKRSGRSDGHDRPWHLDRCSVPSGGNDLRAQAYEGNRGVRRSARRAAVRNSPHAGVATAVAFRAPNGFIGEFLVLGIFEAHPVATTIATTGVIFAAVYLLWAIQRVLFDPADQAGEAGMSRSQLARDAIVAPLIACTSSGLASVQRRFSDAWSQRPSSWRRCVPAYPLRRLFQRPQ